MFHCILLKSVFTSGARCVPFSKGGETIVAAGSLAKFARRSELKLFYHVGENISPSKEGIDAMARLEASRRAA